MTRWIFAFAAMSLVLHGAPAMPVDVLEAISGLPASIATRFVEPVGFVETAKGDFLLLDRREHTVFGINAAKTTVRRVIKVGFETGNVLQPGVLSLGSAETFAVSDAPNGQERIQYFTLDGLFIDGFFLNIGHASRPTIVIDSIVVNGVGTMQYTGEAFLTSQPESGALITQFDLNGHIVRRFGALRTTGQERRPDVHLGLNAGIPLAAPDGGVYFVFRTGAPLIRKYDASGTLVFERHVEGPELDRAIQQLPDIWPEHPPGDPSRPYVAPLVRTAAVDRDGRLWVSLVEPYTYVYDPSGEKVRTVQFRAAGVVSPSSFFFTSHRTVLVTPGCYEFVATSSSSGSSGPSR